MSSYKDLADKFGGLTKQGFIPMPGGQAEPVAGAGPMTAGLAGPMGGPMGGGGAPPMDPAMAGGAPPMDPAMAGGAPPMDPAAGGMPPPDQLAAMLGGDPAAGGMGPEGEPTIPLTFEQIKELVGIGAAREAGKNKGSGEKSGGAGELNERVSRLVTLLEGQGAL